MKKRPRRRAIARRLLGPALTAILVLISVQSFAHDPTGYILKSGIGIYYAVLPAEMIRGYPPGSPEFDMHGGTPVGKHVHHVMIALFEGKTLDRITDAEVTATVAEIGLTGTTKKLEPMSIASAMTYGNYFKLRSLGTYRIMLRIRLPQSTDEIAASFEYEHE